MKKYNKNSKINNNKINSKNNKFNNLIIKKIIKMFNNKNKSLQKTKLIIKIKILLNRNRIQIIIKNK